MSTKLSPIKDAIPLYGTDLSVPPSKLIDALRSQLVHLRGQLKDIAEAYPGFSEEVLDNSSAVTCLIVSLHHVETRMIEVEEKFGFEPNSAGNSAPK